MKKLIFNLIIVFCFISSYSQQNSNFKDTRDNQVYKVVTIGKQIWIAENLAFKTDSVKFCTYDTTKIREYGYLYNLKDAKNVCPSGWHLPSKSEFIELFTTLNGEKYESTGPNTKAFNVLSTDSIMNFNIKYTGYFSNGIGCAFRDNASFFWTSTPENVNEKLNNYYCKITLLKYNKAIYDNLAQRQDYFSIRCLKDN